MSTDAIEAHVSNLKERVDRHLDDCTAASHEVTHRLEECATALKVLAAKVDGLAAEVHEIHHAEERQAMRADIDHLKHVAERNAAELKAMSDWRKWFIQRVLWWGIPIALGAIASSLGLHLAG